jgi:hypothetical protein
MRCQTSPFRRLAQAGYCELACFIQSQVEKFLPVENMYTAQKEKEETLKNYKTLEFQLLDKKI